MFYFAVYTRSTRRLTHFAVLATDVASVFCHIINALRETTFYRQGTHFNLRFFKSHSLTHLFSPLELLAKSRCYTANEDESWGQPALMEGIHEQRSSYSHTYVASCRALHPIIINQKTCFWVSKHTCVKT